MHRQVFSQNLLQAYFTSYQYLLSKALEYRPILDNHFHSDATLHPYNRDLSVPEHPEIRGKY